MNDTGSNVADNLSEDVIWEILTRLRCIKTALKCKAVSKSWLRVVSSPHFMGSLAKRHIFEGTNLSAPSPPPYPFGLIVRPDLAGTSKGQLLYPNNMNMDMKYSLSARFLPDLFSTMTSSEGSPIKVLDSCNDLILCGKDDRHHFDHMYICNPRTIKWITLPTPRHTYFRFFAGFACKPCFYTEDREVMEFSVVLFNCDDGYTSFKSPFQLEAQLFSSLTGKWREVILRFPKAFSTFYPPCSLFYNGIFYMYADDIGMVAFDPIITNTENGKDDSESGIGCRFIEWPLNFVENVMESRMTACICQGNLRLIQKINMALNVWDLKNHSTSEWQVKYEIDLTDLVSRDFSLLYVSDQFTPLTLLGFQPFDDVTLYVCMYNRIVSCDLKTMRLECIFTIPDQSKTMMPDCRSFDLFKPFWLTLQPHFLTGWKSQVR